MRIQTLRLHFKIDVCLESIESRQQCEKFLESGIHYIYNNLKKQKTNIVQKAWNDITILARALLIDEMAAIIKLLKHISNINFSCELCKFVLDLCVTNETNAEHLISLSMLLLAQQIDGFDNGIIWVVFF